MNQKKQIRAQFRRAVFERDRYRCAKCGRPGKDRQGGDEWKKFHKTEPEAFLDAHHITDRSQIINQGYVKENGISLCDDCHIKAEAYWSTGITEQDFTPEALYAIIGSSAELARKCSALIGL